MSIILSHALEHTATEYAAIFDAIRLAGLVVIVGLVILLSPLANLLNIVTMPLGYQIRSCPYCPAIDIVKREYATCEYCNQKFSYYGYPTSTHTDGEMIPFCSSDHLDQYKEQHA